MAVREPKRGRDRQAGREPDADGAAGHIFTDHAMKRAPLIHLTTMQEIERRPGRPVDPLRFERRESRLGPAPARRAARSVAAQPHRLRLTHSRYSLLPLLRTASRNRRGQRQ